jgi:Flp pilus assembly protein TadG
MLKRWWKRKSALVSTEASRCGTDGSARRFRRDNSGNVSMIFAAMIVPVTAAIGMSVDFGQALQQRTKVQGVLDAAVLAGGREYQTSGDIDAAIRVAVAFLNEQAPPGVTFQITRSGLDTSQSAIELGITASVPTSFLRVIGYDGVDFSAYARASLTTGSSGNDIEVAMMLDITGSMSGQRIVDLKAAAKDLVQILLPDQASQQHVRIALAPFSASVNPGSYRVAVRGPDSNANSGKAYGCPANTPSGWRSKQCYRDHSNKVQDANRTNCVSERTGADAFTDAGPYSTSTRVNAAYGATCPSATIMPLSNDPHALKASIDSYSVGGWTAGQIGTAWAWYLLSPEWNGIWPAQSQAGQYGQENLTKIAVLMTDGEYNTEYANFVRARDQYGSPNSPNGRSDYQARQLCQAMKDKGIVVYTVGFQLEDSTAIATMQECATSSSHAFLANDGNELKTAFRSIAFQLAQLRLTN